MGTWNNGTAVYADVPEPVLIAMSDSNGPRHGCMEAIKCSCVGAHAHVL